VNEWEVTCLAVLGHKVDLWQVSNHCVGYLSQSMDMLHVHEHAALV
jgi:hypothetical protein